MPELGACGGKSGAVGEQEKGGTNRVTKGSGEKMARVLDATAGSRMIWFDKQNEDALYMDNRQLTATLCDGRTLNVSPDVIADFRHMPFDDETFYLVVFDPPHLLRAGESSWLAKKYGLLSKDWRKDIAQGFNECMRVLKPNGTLIFKWNEEQVKLSEVLDCINQKPLFGNRRSKTHWMVFLKD
jgi:SAM-dependent methyltransferase